MFGILTPPFVPRSEHGAVSVVVPVGVAPVSLLTQGTRLLCLPTIPSALPGLRLASPPGSVERCSKSFYTCSARRFDPDEPWRSKTSLFFTNSFAAPHGESRSPHDIEELRMSQSHSSLKCDGSTYQAAA